MAEKPVRPGSRTRGPRASVAGLFAVAAALVLLGVPLPSSAQQRDSILAGTVRDASSGAAVRGALVSIGDRGPRALTDSLGAFRLTGVPSGRQSLRAQRFGYQTLDMVLEEGARSAPLELRMAPDPLQLEGLNVTAGVELDVTGVVLDAGTGAPVPWASLELSHDVVRTEGEAFADAQGVFTIDDVPTGAYFLRADKLGYVSQFVMVGHTAPAQPIEVRLEQDSVIMKGLAFMNNELRIRRNAVAYNVMVYDESRLRYSAAPSMKEFLEHETSTFFVPCGGGGSLSCIVSGGRTTMPKVYIDDQPIMDGLGVLWTYDPDEVHGLEIFRCRTPEIRIYTTRYMARMAGRPRIPLAACSFW
jgi:hypothetical protein